MTEQIKIEEIKKLSEEVMELIMKDGYQTDPFQMKRAIELFSQVVYDFTIIESEAKCDKHELLKGTLAKMKIAYNAVYTGVEQNNKAI